MFPAEFRENGVQPRDDFSTRRCGSFNDADLAIHLRVAEWKARDVLILGFLKGNMRHHGYAQTLSHAGDDRTYRVDFGHIVRHHPKTGEFSVDQVG